MVELAQAQACELSELVFVYSKQGRQLPITEKSYNGFTIRYIPAGRTAISRRFHFPILVARDLVHLHPRLVHVHNSAELAYHIRQALPAVPIVLSCDFGKEPFHRIPPLRPISRRLYRRCLDAANVIAPVSQYCRDVFERYWGLQAGSCEILPNGVDCSRFHPDAVARAAVRRRLGLEDKEVILYVGRLCHQKGTDLLIQAYARLRSARPGLALLVVGPVGQFGSTHTGPVVEAIRSVGGIYCPPVDDADLPGIYNAADVFAMPTRDLEMFGMAAVEAQACGKPVVASDFGGLKETVPSGVGLRFPANDAAALQDCLSRLLASPELLRSMAQAAVQNAARYDWPKVARIAESVYAMAYSPCAKGTTADPL
jgi:glycosyltransferase involved in cell wall biosynthesis